MRYYYNFVIFLLVFLRNLAISELSKNISSFLKYDAPSECRILSKNAQITDEIRLICDLPSINSEKSNFTVLSAEYLTSLKVQCNADLNYKSSLNEKSFSHLIYLKELILDSCKLERWPAGTLRGLREIRNLTIKTGNVDWPAISLEISPQSFDDLKFLEKLDISGNNVYSLPKNIFCKSNKMIYLNVSGNRLQDIEELGLRSPSTPMRLISDSELLSENVMKPLSCNVNLRILDISSNELVVLRSNSLSSLRTLEDFRAKGNKISTVNDAALAGLRHLKSLDLSDNKIVSLPTDLFVECADSILEINLRNNSVSKLSPRLFSNLSQLLSLDLSQNKLTSAWMNNGTFSGLVRLKVLNLSKNQISKLDRSFLANLYSLQVLNLENNILDSVPANTFTGLNNLHTLILSGNKIAYLDEKSLDGLFTLNLLSLDNNQIESIHKDSIKNLTVLQDLNLNGNKFKSIPTALKGMSQLKTLDLGENFISNLENPGLSGTTNLYGLRLIANQITNLTRKCFSELPSLQILNLSQNKITRVDPSTFSANTKLEAVRIDGNQLTAIEGVFDQVFSLVWLNISSNLLVDLDYNLFPPSLQWLDVHANLLENLKSENRVNLSVQTLDASFNKLTWISPSSIPDSVELVFLNDNKISHVEPHTFISKTNLARVDLYANNISKLDLTAVQLAPIKDDRPLPEFYLAGNPFFCDCNMEWLQKNNKLGMREHPQIKDIGNVYCELVRGKGSYVPLSSVESSQFLCEYRTHCPNLCECCVFDACDCEMNCPAGCSCFHDIIWNNNIVDCASGNHSFMPTKIPMDATEIYLDGNNFGELTSHSFIGRRKLKALYANNSNIEAIYNYTFSGLHRLTILHLEFNRLKKLSGFEFSSLTHLKELYLNNNELRHIDDGTFEKLKYLEILRLNGNRLVRFEFWKTSNSLMLDISLSSNLWSCDCDFLNEFRTWAITDPARKITDLEKMACWANNGSLELSEFFAGYTNATCMSSYGSHLTDYQTFKEYVPFLILTSTIFLISVILVIAISMYRREIHWCVYSKCFFDICYKRNINDEDDKHGDRLFDAYFIYCVKDEDFVSQIICPNLEHCDSPYRICLHYRDFNANSYVADTILEGAETSKRTVITLSRNFMQTEWCRFEYKSALREILRDRRNKIVFILLGEIPKNELDPDLRLYMKMNTTLQWGDHLFWQKLRFALPKVKEGSTSSFGMSNAVTSPNGNIYAMPVTPRYYTSGRCGRNDYKIYSPPPSPIPRLPDKILPAYGGSDKNSSFRMDPTRTMHSA